MAPDRLCAACTNDADCGGSPCFGDVTGHHYCGRSCAGGCPSGYACLPLQGTAGQVTQSCFPTSQTCAPAADMSTNGVDPTPAPCPPPSGGSVTLQGNNTVDRLYFGYAGDTRPGPGWNQTWPMDSYPPATQSIVNGIFTRLKDHGVEFMIDGGDHMEPYTHAQAKGHMDSYLQAASLLGKSVFMTFGNHECDNAYNTNNTSCSYPNAATLDWRMTAYMDALAKLTGATLPYYRFDVTTQAGLAVFLVVADDAWDAAQQSWLTAQLIDADKRAKYTFVSKHHPDGNTELPAFQEIANLVKQHKYTLFLTGHYHEYKHYASTPRSVIMGSGGAPLATSQSWYGYLTVMQCPDDRIQVTAYDEATGQAQETFSVQPQ
jgi:hypothetical protein